MDVSPFGVRDLASRAREWCQDTPPEWPDVRSVRGGSFADLDPVAFRAASRHAEPPAAVAPNLSFRVCAALPAAASPAAAGPDRHAGAR